MSSTAALPINSVARNSVWVYPAVVASRFPGGHSIVETARSYEMPDFDSLPEGAEVSVELYGGSAVYRLAGDRSRIYIEKFEWVSFETEEKAREEFRLLWESIHALDSFVDVEREVRAWFARRKTV